MPALTVLTGEAGCVVKGDLSALLRYPAALFPGKSGFHIRGEVEERRGLDRAETGPSLPRKIFFFFLHKKGRGGTPLELRREGLSLK